MWLPATLSQPLLLPGAQRDDLQEADGKALERPQGWDVPPEKGAVPLQSHTGRQSQGPPTKASSSPSTSPSETPPQAGAIPPPPQLSPFWVKTLMYSLFSKKSPRGYKNSQQAPVSLRSLTFFHWEFVYSQP